jgi:hypothetical protein
MGVRSRSAGGWAVALIASSFLAAGLLGFAVAGAEVVDRPAGNATGKDFKRVKVKAAGISVAYPRDWPRHRFSKEELEERQRAVEEANPAARERVDAEYQARVMKLYAYSFVDGDNVMVTVEPGFMPNLSQAKAGVPTLFAGVPGFELIKAEKVKVGGERAIRVDLRYEFTDPQGTVLPVYAARLALPKSAFRTTWVYVEVDDNPQDIATADRIIESVRRL